MKAPHLLLAQALAILVASACAQASPPPSSAGQDRAEIEAIVNDYEKGVDDGDLDAAVAMFAPDAVFMPNGGPTQHGIDAIRAYYQNTILQYPLELKFTVDSVEIVGDLAWATAGINGTQTTPDGTVNPIVVNGLLVFRRDATSGQWRVVAYMFNNTMQGQSG